MGQGPIPTQGSAGGQGVLPKSTDHRWMERNGFPDLEKGGMTFLKNVNPLPSMKIGDP